MRLPEWLARFNRRVTNPLQRLWAGRLPPLAIVEHTGRVSGRRYRTPVLAFPTRQGLAIVLFYGRDRDWVANLQAAGGGSVMRGGRTVEVADPTVVIGQEVRELLPDPLAALVAARGRQEVLALRTVHTSS